jgi:hypothetical protein
MIRIIHFLIYSLIIFALAGCDQPAAEKPIWEDVNLGDLAPDNGDDADDTAGQVLESVSINVYVFEIPAEEISALDPIWQLLFTEPIKFDNISAFNISSFSIGQGQINIHGDIHQSLEKAGAKEIQKASLLLTEKMETDFNIANLPPKTKFFYPSQDDAIEISTFGRGSMALRMQAQKPYRSRGLCSISMTPVYKPYRRSFVPNLDNREKSEHRFSALTFNTKMTRGDFLLLAPRQYLRLNSLASIFFTRNNPEPTVRFYLIVCSRITF